MQRPPYFLIHRGPYFVCCNSPEMFLLGLIRCINLFSTSAALWWVKYMQNQAIADFVGETDSPKTFMNPSGCFRGCTDRMQKPANTGRLSNEESRCFSGMQASSSALSFLYQVKKTLFGFCTLISDQWHSLLRHYFAWMICMQLLLRRRRIFHATGVWVQPQRFTVQLGLITCCNKAWLEYERKISITFASSWTSYMVFQFLGFFFARSNKEIWQYYSANAL